MKKLLVMCVVLAAFVGPVSAQEQAVSAEMPMAQKTIDPMTLMKDAVMYATRADAYNAYCADEPSSMASDYLDQFFLKESVTIEQKNELAGVMETEVQAFLEMLNKDQPKCEDLEFMMGRLEVMRKLKDVSYLLNGVDPATLPPDNIPELEQLLLPKDPDTAVSPASLQ